MQHDSDMEPVHVKVPGIQNLGNTCFFNAILQALAAVDSFREYLEQVIAQSALRGQSEPFTRALAQCISDLAPVSATATSATVMPRDLNQELVSKLSRFRGNKQQDAQELLQFLINLINDEQKRSVLRDRGLSDLLPTLTEPTKLSNGGGSSSSTSSRTDANGSPMLLSSISDSCFEEAMEERRWNPLYGLQVDLLQCAGCSRYRPMKNRRFLDVSLSFGDDQATATAITPPNKQVTLWDCLRMYTAPETVADVECVYCTASAELALKKQERDALARQLQRQPLDMETELALLQLKDDIHTLDVLLQTNVDKLAADHDLSDVRCRALRPCRKQLQFSRCPTVFCFHFTRKVFHASSGSTRKLDTHVVFPLEMDMAPFCQYERAANGGRHPQHPQHPQHTGRSTSTPHTTTPSTNTQPARAFLVYELMAVILHHGTDRYGHFTAYRRVRSTNQWFFLSDESVREASAGEVLGSCAYMLFYERKHQPPPRMARTKPNGVHRAHSQGTSSEEADEDEETEKALARVPDFEDASQR